APGHCQADGKHGCLAGAGTARTPSGMTRAGSRRGSADLTARLLRKTRLCVHYAKGHCARGEDCGFAHGSGDVRTAPDFSHTRPCRSFARARRCRQGDACRFAHDPGKMLPWKCSGAARDEPGPPCDAEGRARARGGPPGAAQGEGQPRTPGLVSWALEGRLVTAVPAPRLREVPALRGREWELPSQLKVTVKRTFLQFFEAEEEGDTIGCCRRCSSAPPVVWTD
ncbi:unnamed protein product, partial [Prorocentrum cordatum]